jgi:potassium channel subfamily K, other eukaryote
MIIVLLCYITFGSLVQTFILETTFIDALYFSVVSIETIGEHQLMTHKFYLLIYLLAVNVGFGDIYPKSTGSRIFASLYISGGIINLALAVALSQEALLEGAAAGFRERVKRLRARQRKRTIRERWKAALKWRLQSKNLPLWIANECVAEPRHDSRDHNHCWTSIKQACSPWRNKVSRVAEVLPCYAPRNRNLNLNALTQAQLEAAALEAGAPLADLLPSRLETPENDAGDVDIQPQPLLTHMRIGGMVSLLGQFAVTFAHNQVDADTQTLTNPDNTEYSMDKMSFRERFGVPFTRTLTTQDEESFLETLKAEEKLAFIARLSIACLIFLIFWMVRTFRQYVVVARK